jgi:hypothetical protein
VLPDTARKDAATGSMGRKNGTGNLDVESAAPITKLPVIGVGGREG